LCSLPHRESRQLQNARLTILPEESELNERKPMQPSNPNKMTEPEISTKAVYYIGTYDIDDPELFKQYPVLVRALLPKYSGEVLASDTSAYPIEGQPRRMNAIIRFPSKEAALGLYNDADYQEAKRIRQASTSNCTMVLVQELPR
jgi:uncharacterized protein (DUF1330 family)